MDEKSIYFVNESDHLKKSDEYGRACKRSFSKFTPSTLTVGIKRREGMLTKLRLLPTKITASRVASLDGKERKRKKGNKKGV